MRTITVAGCIALTVTLALAGCGGTSGKASTTAPPAASVVPTTTAVPKPTAAAADPLAAWCRLTIGEDKAAVLAAMGTPHGTKVSSYAAQSGLGSQVANGIEMVEWDVGQSLLAATFTNGKATNLQAYDRAVGPAGATNIACAAFRH
jgi:hypothetical protein